jgi:hypothetical protein
MGEQLEMKYKQSCPWHKQLLVYVMLIVCPVNMVTKRSFSILFANGLILLYCYLLLNLDRKVTAAVAN